MVDQGIHGRRHQLAEKLFKRGLIGDILNAPGNIVSQVLSSPATATQDNVQAEGTPAAAATTQAAAAPAATTQAAAAPVPATTSPAAEQPVASPAAATTKQEQQQAATTPVAQAPAAATTTSQQEAQVSSTTVAAANPPAASTTSSAEAAAAASSIPPAAVTTVPAAAENAASSPVLSQAYTSQGTATGVISAEAGEATSTRSDVANTTQTPSSNLENKPQSNNQGPLVATGVVLGIVMLMGLSLLIFWCCRRRRRAAHQRHEAIAPESPNNEYGPASPFRDHIDRSFSEMTETEMTENHTITSEDESTIQHPEPGYQPSIQPPMSPQTQDTPRTNPYAATPFSYAQAQQYVQSLAGTGTFGFPPPPPIPEPSPIRIFRWPTRSSRSGNSTPSVFSGLRTPKTPTRALSRASQSTMSSMLWHGRRDVARRTISRSPGSHKSTQNVSSLSPESTMPEGLHTPILDWLHWIRGHQQVEPDPEMNHRKSFASTTESSISETSVASTASSDVFSPTLLSYHPPATTPSITPETFQYLPLPLFNKRRSDVQSEVTMEASGTIRIPSFG